jgi:hypothetical protein
MRTAEGCARRRQRLWNALPEAIDVIVLADPKSLSYFASFAPLPFVFRRCDPSAVLLLTQDSAMLER